MRYDLRYTRNFNRFLGGISRLSNLVGENPILLVPAHDQICLITCVPCSISFFLKVSEVFNIKKKTYTTFFFFFFWGGGGGGGLGGGVLCNDRMHAKAMVCF